MGYLGLLLLMWGGVVCALRVSWRWRKKAGKSRWGYYPTDASMGNALHALQAIAQPRAQHVIVEMLEEPTDEDDEAGTKDPTAHLMRQARRIRNGEKLEGLTALLPP
jgi:hypothetical protein